MTPEEFQLEWIKRHATGLHVKYDGSVPDKSDNPGGPVKTPHRGVSGFPHRGTPPAAARTRHPFETTADADLDLHGMTIDQALVETEIFLDMAREYGLTAVRIIHGIGPDSGPSIRTELTRAFKTRFKGKIERLEYEPHNSGSVIIFPCS
ncbi:MAG: Smr/MutS family protein [Fibrobacterota bacterium]